MSGILGIGGGGDTEFYPYALDQSVRFNDNDSAYLTRTPSSDGNLDNWTFSAWTKLANADNGRYLLGASIATGKWFHIAVNTSGQIDVRQFNNTSYDFRKISSAVLRDVSAWYHIVVSYDSTNGTAEDRIKVYLNGERITSFGTNENPSSGVDSYVNQNHAHTIGAFVNNNGSSISNYYDGYLSEVNLVDGETLDPTSFGETKNGIWIPKEYTGSYGTNGFYLNFKDDIVSEGFNTATYQGNGATQSISGLGFSPDFVWLKQRNASGSHAIYDSVRGATKRLYSNLQNAEATQADSLTSFDGDGFSLGTAYPNTSSNTFVAWAWDAGTGSAASNTDGDITSTVKANTAYGFSVVQFESDGVNEVQSVGHGLGTAPSFIITKNIDGTTNWPCYHASLGDNYRIDLNGSGTSTDNGQQTFGSATDTFSVWKSNLFGSGTCIAYCFAEISGYSKIGSYTGTGASGKKITTGFEPAFVMVKSYDQTRNWIIWDNTRTPANPADGHLHPNADVAEQTGSDEIQFDSDGFTFLSGDDDSNANTYNYIYMAFADTRDYAFWKDQSGNGNHFTPENLDYTDTLKDSPTNNFAVLNAVAKSSGITLSDGNLKADGSSGGAFGVNSTLGMTSGKWYTEFIITDRPSPTGNGDLGIFANSSGNPSSTGVDDGAKSCSIRFGADDGDVRQNNATVVSTGISFTNGDVINIAFDRDDGKVWFGKNGTYYNSGNPAAGTNATYSTNLDDDLYFFNMSDATGSATVGGTFNFGQDSTFAGNLTAGGNADANGIGDFKYTVPSGYLALCAANLPDPAIDPAQDSSPEDYFGTLLFTGDGTSGRTIATGETGVTGNVNFTPDWVWIKSRSDATNHLLTDVLRGGTAQLRSNLVDAESQFGNVDLTFTDGGFTNAGSSSNESGRTFVAWNWKAGGTAVSNTDGSITSSVSASPESGFSIVTYTGTGANATVGHGLGKAPDMIILKKRADDTQAWQVYHSANTSEPETEKLTLNTTAATVDDNTTWNDTAPTSTVFSIGTGSGTNENTDTYVAYCFAEIEGYSKFGVYTGNASTDGAFVYTGFRPAFVMCKRTGSTGNWPMFDNKRDVDNEVEHILQADISNAELSPYDRMDFVSNGFKLRDTGSGVNNADTIIYMAFAEQPFKYANAR